jgi:hypothetical protein
MPTAYIQSVCDRIALADLRSHFKFDADQLIVECPLLRVSENGYFIETGQQRGPRIRGDGRECGLPFERNGHKRSDAASVDLAIIDATIEHLERSLIVESSELDGYECRTMCIPVNASNPISCEPSYRQGDR